MIPRISSKVCFVKMSIQDYIELFSSLLTPLIAIIMVYIAYQQWRTNHLKARHELFESRVKIYDATMELIFTVITLGYANRERILQFREKTVQSPFLFGDDINGYLKVLVEKATKLKQVNEESDRAKERGSNKNKDYEKLSKVDDEIFSWFTGQPDVVKEKFMKYLDLSNK